ncbi:PREDICTED: M-phase inducer phosphatase-like [Amphimedon queenslandica]|uniref:M-phase inducer phosphatase n=1 Tax=Amphimedon queenslandica TaxID=400682 RepID=A0A1X7VCX1_AMPQE|nr:PREDICTED: M-phase inducer phosphatase-like [Amphimedon queenslandica]|eukprot:XP_003384718.1 PREDICTED: M-phase inducer phosphatase-like [Amphimedon queenslandica]
MSQRLVASMFSPVTFDISPEEGNTVKRTPRRKLCLDDSIHSPTTTDSACSTSCSMNSDSECSTSIDRRHSLATYPGKENVCSGPLSGAKLRPLSFSSLPLSPLSSNRNNVLTSKPLMKHISSPLERMTLASPNSCSSDGYFSDVFDCVGEDPSQEMMPKCFSSLFAAPISSNCDDDRESPVSRRGSMKRSLLETNDERESKKTPLPSPSSFTALQPPSSPPAAHKSLKGVALFRSQSVCVPPPCEDAMFPDSPGSGGVERIGDHTKPYLLPLTQGTVPDQKSISPDTVESLLNGKHDTKYLIVDCRYPYEYEGGHIRGAINIWEKDTLLERFFSTPTHPKSSSESEERNIIVFHCEFSSKRAPEMSRFMRKVDRERNGMEFPKLYYPELYLIEGGYKNFYATHPDLCEPKEYKTMLDTGHKVDLMHFSRRSKSWAGHSNVKGSRLRHRHSVPDIH